MTKRLLPLLALVLVLFPAAAEAPLVAQVEAGLEASYRPGEHGEIAIRLVYDDPASGLTEGVAFLNVVERDPAHDWPQAAHKIFASASETPKVFRVVQSLEQLRAGLGTTLSFRLRDDAEPGEYALVVQLYRGSNTDPNRVRVEDRVLLKGFDFQIVAK